MRLPLLDSGARGSCGCTDRVLNVAHRGASDVAPENTMAALVRAVEAGADMVEVDVQRSRDGALVLLHDTTLARTTDVRRVFPSRAPWRVADFTYDELRRLDAGSWKAPEFARERLLTLEEAMQVVWGGGRGLLVELKEPGLYPGVVSEIASAVRTAPGSADAVADGRLVVQSFNVAAVKEHKTREPSVPVGVLGAPREANLPALATWADQVNPGHRSVDQGYVDHVRALGMKCQLWTVNRRPAMQRALRLGVDGVITNRPVAFARLLARHRGAHA